MIFLYSEKEVGHLKMKDKRLGEAIDVIGRIERTVDPSLFSSVVRCIVGQQISTAAQATIWQRINHTLGRVTPEAIFAMRPEDLQSHGVSFRKADYIQDFAGKVLRGELDIESLQEKSDEEVIAELTALKGIGVWTAEMLMIFSMQRPDILSFGDLAIHRGMRMLYHHREVTREMFEKYRRRYSPYGSVASLYLWAVAGGTVPGMRDYAPKRKKTAK